MKARLLNKINRRIRIVKNDSDKFEVEVRDFYTDWHRLREFKTYTEAHYQKVYYIKKILIKDFGLQSRYINRLNEWS